MKHGATLLSVIVLAALLGACSNFLHELVPPDGDRIISFKIPGQVRAAMISDDAIMITVAEGTNVRGLLPSITVSPRAMVLPITFNYLQTAFPSADILDAALGLYTTDDPAAYIENLVRSNKDFKVPALNIPIDFSAPVDIYVIAARGNMRRYTVYVSVENETNQGTGVEWPRLLGMGFSKANNPCLHADSLCWIIEDSRTVNATVRYMPDSGFNFALVPTFVIWGDRVELDGNEITSDISVIQFNAEPTKQTGTLTLWRGGNSVSYTLNLTFTEDLGVNGPMLEGLRFAKYDNPELVIDAVCSVNENNLIVNARALYPVEMPNLSFALVPSFEILGDRLEIGGVEVHSGDETNYIQFNKSLGVQNKTLTVWRNGKSKDYALTITFEEDPDTVRSITDFRFVKQDNSIAANAVASIVNTDNTGAITVQVFYSGIKPSSLVPRFVSPGNVSVSGAAQASGTSSQDFSSPLTYRVVSRNGQFTRTYTVRVEFLNLMDAAPRITSFRFSQNLNPALTQDDDGLIHDDTAFITINAYYGGAFPPEQITPEFSAEGIVQVMGSVQISTASPQDFNRPIRYTVVHPLNSLLKRDYWVYTTMVQDSASHAIISKFSFHPDDNPGLRDELTARIDQMTGKISVNAPIGSGLTARTMYPRFTAAGHVSVAGNVQASGASGQMFNSPVVYTVVSTNGLNSRNYTVEVRELSSTMYVNQNAVGSGDGTSWENAFRYLQTACEAAAQFPEDAPKEIWIAKGTYTPADIDGYFPLSPNTSYIGGFAGNETSKSQRNIAANAVTVSGRLGTGSYARHLFAAVTELNGDLSFENLRLTGVKGQQGAGIYAPIDAASEISITNCNFSDMETSGAEGSAVYAKGGRALVSDVEFSACNNGNALWLDCSGDTELTRVNVADSSANAFYLSGNGNKTLETLTVLRGGSGLNVQNSTGYVRVNGFVMRDLTGAGITMNGANGVKYLNGITARNTNGNAINSAASSGTFTLTGSSIFDNTGIISVSNGSGAVSVLNTEIKNSKGSSAVSVTANGNTVIDALSIDGVPNGRGIYISGDGKTDITNTTIKNCVSYSNGGGIYSGGGSLTAEKIKIYNITGNNTTCAGIYHSANSDLVIDDLKLENISGYGIYSTGSGVRKFSDIKAVTGIGGAYGVYAASMTSGSFVLSDSAFTSCGVYCSASGAVPITVNDTDISNAKGAAGLYVSTGTGTVTIEWVTIDGVPSGKGIDITSNGKADITNTIIRSASSDGMYVSGSGTFTMKGGTTISGNTSSGVYISSGTFTMKSGAISGNSYNGVFINGGTFTMEGGIISNNYSSEVTINSGTFTMKSGAISGNNFTGVLTGSGTFILEGGTISGNYQGVSIATGTSGGTFTMKGGTISSNTSSGVNASGGTFILEGGEIFGNGYNGVSIGGTFTMKGGTISGNAWRGVGIDNNGTFTMEGGTIFGNDRGGVYSSGTFTMKGGEIRNNNDSGVSSSGSFTMEDGKISNNTGTHFGGGVYVSGGTFILKAGTISGNTVTQSGGGVHVNTDGTFIMSGGTISGNTAVNTGSIARGGGVSGGDRNITITKTGGTIYGNDGTANANTVRNTSGAMVNNQGHAVHVYVYIFSLSDFSIIDYFSKRRDSTAGPGVNLSFAYYLDGANTATATGGWDN